MPTTRWLRLALPALMAAVLVASPTVTRAAPAVDISKLKIESAMAVNEADLVKRSDLIVYGWLDSGQQEAPTGDRISGHQVVNYVQTIHVKRVLKGSSGALAKLLTTGLTPLPEPKDPLNSRFTGPLAEGNYVCFLRSVPNTSMYSLAGLWQGVYPVYQDRTVSLEESGFSSLSNLRIEQLAAKLNALSAH